MPDNLGDSRPEETPTRKTPRVSATVKTPSAAKKDYKHLSNRAMNAIRAGDTQELAKVFAELG